MAWKHYIDNVKDERSARGIGKESGPDLHLNNDIGGSIPKSVIS